MFNTFHRILFKIFFYIILPTLVAVRSHETLEKNPQMRTESEKFKNYCTTDGCKNAAKVILNYMDPSFDPCKNFYAYTCGGYYKKSEIPKGEMIISPIQKLKHRVNERLKKLLEEEIKIDEPRIFSLVKTFYKTCLEIDNEDGEAEMKKIIKQLGGWPVVEGDQWNETAFNWVDLDIKLRLLGYQPINIFSIFVEKTYVLVETKKTALLHVNPMTPHISSAALKKGTVDPITYYYLSIMYRMAKYFGATEERADREMEEVFDFETKLYEATTQTGKEKLTFLGDIDALIKYLPSVPWIKYIDGLMQPVAENFSASDPIIKFRNPWYFSNVRELLEKTSNRTIANYMIWRTIATSLPYLGGKIRRFWKEEQYKLNYPQTELIDRSDECIKLMSNENGVAIGLSSLYVKRYFDNLTIADIQPILQAIFNQFEIILDKVQWMDEESKYDAKEKNTFMKQIIAYPDEILNDTLLDTTVRNLNFDGTHFFRNVLNLKRFNYDFLLKSVTEDSDRKFWIELTKLTSINAAYFGDHNTFILLAGLLQPPLFNIDWPYSAKFGSIGFIMAHEMMHAYDVINVNKDRRGYLHPWMRPNAAESYQKRQRCFISQYRKYKSRAIGANVGGNFTLDENLADNIGLKVAYYAFKTWLLDHPNEPALPGLNLTPEQIFWMTSMHFLCNKNTIDYRISVMWLKSDTHPLGGFRVRGSVSNSYSFPKAFNCSVGSPMNPEKKCRLF